MHSVVRSRILLLMMIIVAGSLAAQPVGPRIYWIAVAGGPTGDFQMSATEVTFAQYDAFCEATGREKPEAIWGRGLQPVVNVTQADAQAYCGWLSKIVGATVRLPNEEEWHYAAAGGAAGDHYVFSGSGNPHEVAWFEENSEEDEFDAEIELDEPRAHLVATKQPNLLGMYDMSGNVWEWVATPNYAMGGSYKSIGQDCFPYAKTNELDEGFSAGNLGFRVLLKK